MSNQNDKAGELLPLISPLKPFLELPMCITNNEGGEKEVTVRIQPCDIAYYYPGFHWGVVVTMKSGASYLLKTTVEEFDGALLAYQQAVIRNPLQFGNLKITPKSKLHALD